MKFQIVPERPEDAALNAPLLDRTFGSQRQQKTVYRLRDGILPLSNLCFSAIDEEGGLLASLRFWPIQIQTASAILLGPLAVEPALQGRGMGRALLRHGLREAKLQGHKLCVVVGEADYYAPFGFVNATAARLILPGPVDLKRFLVAELAPDSLDGVAGLIGPVDILDLSEENGAVA